MSRLVQIDSPASHKRRSSVSDAAMMSMSGSFLDCTTSPEKQSDEVEAVTSETPRKIQSPRQQVFMELVQTESNYVGILHTIMSMFKSPLENMSESEDYLLNNTELKIIFGNLPPIYEVHKQMLEELCWAASHWKEDFSIGNVFLKYLHVLHKCLNCLENKGKVSSSIKEFTSANKWIRQPDDSLTSSEWRLALKMTANVCPLLAIPGRSQDRNHCHRCVSEIETLGHVLGACPFSETLQNSRHYRIRSMIAEALRKKGFTVHEEVHGISQEGSCRRIDMLAIPPGSTSAYIIDPSVKFKAQEQQPAEIHYEKCRIYEPTVPFYLEKYHLTSIEVVGLMVGARGTIPRLFVTFCKKF
ncbi:hypothetical protein ANN_17842 [Periplaneta americana]|uniref:DH domain-containing protein n=1 Tax=Periplaneta americana TaxID=6978 RepID=A0ABQ8SU87_PERAM|nr:hypothetical protein ANN_17842 [Periplaneta americana]